ncbi:MAG TPA: hypothetical protein VLX61_03860 [Anaerolineales bacterium]|nr:hypothetical protein [Anaerolineales bacterium]
MLSRTFIIPQKLPGSRSYYDLASDQMPREITFDHDAQFAIVLAACYGHGENLYFLANDEEEAAEISKDNSDYSHAILDADGNHYEIDGDRLRKIKY